MMGYLTQDPPRLNPLPLLPCLLMHLHNLLNRLLCIPWSIQKPLQLLRLLGGVIWIPFPVRDFSFEEIGHQDEVGPVSGGGEDVGAAEGVGVEAEDVVEDYEGIFWGVGEVVACNV